MAAGLFHTRRGEVGQAAAPVPMTRERRPQRAWLLPAVVATICLAPFTPLLLPDDRVITDSIFCDYGSFQLPIREFARQEFLSGRFPLWIPYLGCGTPLHAGQQASLCQPILTPLVLLLGANHGIKVSLFVHLALAFAGTYWLARDLSISRWGGSLAGVVATWGAFPVMHLMEGHVIIVDEYALAPWFLVSLNRLLATPTPRNAAFLALTIGCMAVSGQPQILYYTLLFGFLWAAGSLVFCGQRSSPLVGWDKLAEQAPAHREKGRRQKSSSAFILLPSAFYNGGPALASSLVPPYGSAAAFRMRVIAWGAAALACGCLLGAVQLLPSLELTLDGLSQSERGRSEYASQHALNAIDFARLLVPNAMGNPLCGLKRFDEVDFVHERIGYLGVLPLLLAVYGLTRRSCARWQWGAATLVLFGLTIALGNNTPAFGLMGRSIPGLTLFRCPGRIFSVLTPLIAVLAARGLDVWAERFTNVKLRRTRSRFHTNPKRKRGFAAFSRSSLALRVCVRRLRTGFGEALRPKGGIPAAWRLALAGCAISALIAFGGVAVYQRYEWSGYVDYAQRHVLWELAASAATIVVAAAVLCTLPRRLPPALCCLAALAATMLDLGDQTLGNFSLEPRQAVTAPSVGNGLRAVPGPRVGNGLRAVPGPSNADLADETAWEGHPPIRLVV
ncbi:MAG TPA: hypothetical protein VNH11_31210, partial [Pirellulales bacterium]|nr:hypothetical protein [Pirellulales bacterium]